ncbi:putative N-acetylated-alpha-linked acidic dipeptidase isoform X1 [Macrobrachium rosenbergii]|uniref:putative N-acetylated-alpha-linked acidic dipeptidase isoform X1 n=1 Tax=Macrobrachium rosenbergii TaxID=79674 RepID=UPI0034D3AB3E
MKTPRSSALTGCLWGAAAFAVISVMVVAVVTFSEREKRFEEAKKVVPIQELEEYIINNINPDNIRNYLREMTRKPSLGGTEGERELARWIEGHWKEQGLDEVHLVPYQVLLSYPSPDVPNLVRIVDSNDDRAIWVSASKQKPLYAEEEDLPELPFTFNGYAFPGNVTSDVVYANYGREQDFDFLESKSVDLTGKIIIARYGKIYRANIAEMAEARGAVGVVLFSDPIDYSPEGLDFVYPNSYFMPPSAAPFGTVKLVEGDPLTPFYPATESAFHIPEEEARIPKVPVQPISPEDAWQILSRMEGETAPSDWQGGLNFTYRLGPGFQQKNLKVNLDVNNENTPTTTYNVIGIIKGSVEPDRYVLLGNHYDAWIFGSIDPHSGTAAMLELSRLLMQLTKEKGWRPRRSLVFCAWGAEEHGIVASLEWAEQFEKQLASRAVAYLNVDMAIEGNYTLRTKSAPLLYDVIFEGTKKIPNPNPEEVAEGRTTVYDTWALRRPDTVQPGLPLMQFIGSGSDYKGFQHNIGIPSMDVRYTHDNATIGEPLYHTLYETFAAVDEIYDRGFLYHKAVTALWGDVAVVLSESKILPYSLGAYADFISRALEGIINTYEDLIATRNITLEFFTEAVANFDKTVKNFTEELKQVDMENPLQVRKVNDQIMMVERAFIDPRGLPGRPEYNHVVMAPSQKDAYSGTAFAGLKDTLVAITETSEDKRDGLWRTFAHHLAAVTHLLNTAAKVLTDDLW